MPFLWGHPKGRSDSFPERKIETPKLCLNLSMEGKCSTTEPKNFQFRKAISFETM
jgi:hypothetical protein